MYRLVQKFYALSDRFVGITDHDDAQRRARARSLTVWSTVAGPLVLFLNLAAHGFDVFEPAVLAITVGTSGTISSLVYLRLTRNLEIASLIFLCSSVIGMSIASWIASEYNLLPLASLTATPVFFGLLLSWKQCLRFTFGLTAFIFLTAAWFGFSNHASAYLVFNSIAFAFAAFGVGFSTAGYAYTNARAARKLKQQKEEIQALAYRDPLTGLKNLRALDETIAASLKEGDVFTLAFMDLDRFKPINDQYGHSAGDALLIAIAERLMDSSFVSYAARIGGDEFAFVLKSRFVDDAADDAIKEIHAAITEFVIHEHVRLLPGVSIGYAENSSDLNSVSLLVVAAESAMRRAKQNKIGWRQYDQDIDNASLESGAIELAFRSALDEGHIRAALQPIVCARTRDIKGFELLSRWTDSNLPKDPGPDQFIPIAERLGLLNELLWNTLRETLCSSEIGDKTLSINVSPAQLLATDFLPKLIQTLREGRFDPSKLTLEVTEDVAFRNLDKNVKVLQQARRHGISIALDDFGCGYSSLSIVEKLPLDKIKIDRSLVMECDRNERRESLLEIAIQMAHKLGLESCVEGVETVHVAEKAETLGAGELQGFLFGKPKLITAAEDVSLVA